MRAREFSAGDEGFRRGRGRTNFPSTAAVFWSDAGRGFSVRRPFAAGVARRGILCGRAVVAGQRKADFVWPGARRGAGGRCCVAGRGGCRRGTGHPGKCSGLFYGAGRFCVVGRSPRGWLVDAVWLAAHRGDWSISYAGTVRIDCRPLVGGLPSGRFRGTIGRLTFAGIFGARARGFRPGARLDSAWGGDFGSVPVQAEGFARARGI